MKKVNRGMNLPDQDHVIRHVSSSKLRRDEFGNILGFLPQAFELRPNENSLSVNWVEYFDGDYPARTIKTIREICATKVVRKNSAFGIGNVGLIKGICKKNRVLVKIVYAPTSGIFSHSEIRRLPNDDLSLLAAIATDAFCEIVHVSDIAEQINIQSC